eukprot:TRINITY_DN26050_c0_g1_i2.p1 TRINITY_DN26050_c0_g1~~TRINITY_DN26050_c0_g1_i2.p1  ORF type:complete len:445 (+),score=108.18 TRINITY_DN26050_c0_g1_i2:125-1459(+)
MKRNNGEDGPRNGRRPLQDLTNNDAPEKIVGQKSKREEDVEQRQVKKQRHTVNEQEVEMIDCTPTLPTLKDLKISEAEAIDVWKDDKNKFHLDVYNMKIQQNDEDSNCMDLSGTLGQFGEDESKEFSEMGLASLDNSTSNNVMNTSLAEEQEEEEEEDKLEDDSNPVLRAIDDIDAADEQDPAWATEYVVDVYKNLRDNEIRNRITDYLATFQTSLTPDMRGILADWLVEVSEEYHLASETLFLTVTFVDRFLTRVKVERTQFQLVGITAMLLASKFEEVTPPSINDFVVVSADTYKKADIVDMEILMLNALSFQLVSATPKAFVRRYLKAAFADMLLAFLVNYLIELTLAEYWYSISVLPSTVAAAAVCLGLMILGREPWTPCLEHHTGYGFADESFSQCVQQLYWTFKRAPSRRQRAVVEKYKDEKFLQVALIPAPEGLMGD